jgi:hypothetical protein
VRPEGAFQPGILQNLGGLARRGKNIVGGEGALARSMVDKIVGELFCQGSHLGLLQWIAAALRNDAFIELVERFTEPDHQILEIRIKQAFEQAAPFFRRKAFLPVTPELHQLRGGGAQINRHASVDSDSGEQLHCRQ